MCSSPSLALFTSWIEAIWPSIGFTRCTKRAAFLSHERSPTPNSDDCILDPVDRSTGLICDQIVEFTVFYSQKDYPERLRRIRYRDSEGRPYVFLTNHLSLPAITICDLYRLRWQVELFFKWIKQHLRIKRFFGNSDNAVKTQVWIAVSVYVLIAIIRQQLQLPLSLHEILQILSVTPFENVPLIQLLTETQRDPDFATSSNQLNLF